MSSNSTGVRKRRTTDDRADDTLKQVEDGYIRKAKRFTDQGRQETGNAGPGAIGGASIPGASYLPVSGKYGMIGSIAFNPIAVIIDDGRIDITPNQSGASKDSSYILVTGQGSPDDLRFIDGATKNGQIFWLQGTLTQIINLKAATISGIDTISGLLTVTVVTTSNHNLTTNDKINILATTNFNVNDVEVTVIDPTTFTYSAVGNITPESAGFVQNGNFVTDTGDDVILDGTKSTNGVPMIPIIFDPTVAGNGAWRPAQLVSVNGGGGSLSEPIELGFNEAVTQTPPTLTTIAGDIFNPTHVTLDKDIELDLVISATTSKYKSIFVIFDTTGGGFTVTWPASVVNPPTIPDTVAQRISVILYTINNGTLWTHATSVGSSTGGEFFGPWTANHDAGLRDLTNVKNIDFNDALSTVFGLVDLQWFQAGHQFTSVSGEFNYRVDTLDKHIFHGGANPILEIDDATGLTMLGSHGVSMGNNLINLISELQFAVLNTHTPSNETTIAFDFTDKELKSSVALTTDAHSWYANTDRLASIVRTGTDQGQLNIHDIISDILQVNNQFIILDSSLDPGFNGEFRKNGADVKVFTGGVVVNFSNLGASNQIFEGDSSVLVTDIGAPIDAKIEFILNGGVVGSFTPISFIPTIPIDMIIGLNIINIDNLRFLQNSGNISLTATGFVSDTNGLRLNLEDSADLFTLTYNSATVTHQWSNTAQTSPNLILNNTLVIQDSSTNPSANGIFSRNGNVLGLEIPEFSVRRTTTVDAEFTSLNIVKVDASPGAGDQISRVNFQIDDSGVITTYASIQTIIQEATDATLFKIQIRSDNVLQDALIIEGNDNSTQFQFLLSSNGNTRIQPLGSARAAYFVTPQTTDFLTNLGTSGTLEFPRIEDSSPTVNDLNSAAGSFNSVVIYSPQEGRVYVRDTDTSWDFWTKDGTLT